MPGCNCRGATGSVCNTISRIWLRFTATTFPPRVLTVSFGVETLQHSVGFSSTKTLQSVLAATRLVLLSCACTAPVANATLSAAALLEICEHRLGRFKTPDVVHFLDELPKGPSGKIQRLKLSGLLVRD